MNNETRDDRLGRLLREADPAANDPGLTLDEARDMRRTVLSAVPERKRRLFPIFATAGAVLVAALVLITVLTLWPSIEKPSAPPQVAVVPPKAVQPPPPPKEEPRLAEEKTEEKKPPVRRKRRAPRPPRPPIVQPEPVEPEAVAVMASAEPQQIQFSTPGGTRIIWILSPGDDSVQGE